MDKKYTTILFDLGNTIIRFDHNIAVKKLESRFKIDPKKAYDLFFDSELTRLFETGMISESEFHKKASLALGIEVPFEDFMGIWNGIFWEDKGSCELARVLKKSYKLFLLSNVNKAHFEYIYGKFDIIKIFDELILSYLVGAMKPDKRIFDDAIRRTGGDRKKIIYIDDREDLVKEATAMGIDSIRYENSEKLSFALKDRGVLV